MLRMNEGNATKSGIFIVFEGIDGAGKSTQVRLLAEKLTAAGETVVVSKEPTDGEFGRELRESAKTGRLSLDRELQLFIDDRKQHVNELILPSLSAGKVVILDRYFYSTVAYQGIRGADPASILESMRFAPVPDMALVFDAPPELTLARIENDRGETPNEFEKQDALQKCREIFLGLIESRSECFRIDASQTASDVEAEIARCLLDNVLRKKRCAQLEECDFENCPKRLQGQCHWAKLKEALCA